MDQQADIPVIKSKGVYLQKRNDVIPLDLDWRKQYYHAVVGRRVVAFILDYFTTFFIAAIPTAIFFPNDTNSETTWAAIVFQLMSFTVLCAFMESSKWQGSIGKRIMKIQITDCDGYSISFGRALLRNLLRIVIGYSYFLIIPLILQIIRFQKTKKLFHDELSHTIIGRRLG